MNKIEELEKKLQLLLMYGRRDEYPEVLKELEKEIKESEKC